MWDKGAFNVILYRVIRDLSLIFVLKARDIIFLV